MWFNFVFILEFSFSFSAADILDLKILSRTESTWDKLFQNSKYEITENESQLGNLHENKTRDESQVTKKKICTSSAFKTRHENESAPSITKDFSSSVAKVDPLANQMENLCLKESNYSSGTMVKRRARTSVGEILAGGSHSNEFRYDSIN